MVSAPKPAKSFNQLGTVVFLLHNERQIRRVSQCVRATDERSSDFDGVGAGLGAGACATSARTARRTTPT